MPKTHPLETAFSDRQYMHSEDFELYYYNDTRLTNVKRHKHDYYEFYFFLEGDVEQRIGAQLQTLKPGDVVVIPPGTSHRTMIMGHPYRRFILWLSASFYNTLLRVSQDYGYLVSSVRENGIHVFHHDPVAFNALQSRLILILEEMKAQRFGYRTRIYGAISDLMIELNRHAFEADHPQRTAENRGLYLNVLSYVNNHLSDDLSLDTLAGVFFVSKYHLSHLFKENTGTPLHAFIVKKRLAACRDAILSGTDTGEAATLFGFSEYSSFYRAFKKEYGVSPRTLRIHRQDNLAD